MRDCLNYIYERVNDNPQMVEDELYEVLLNSGFFKELGYKKFGKDVRAQYVLAGKRKKADYICRDEYQNVVFVLEAKRPSVRNLRDALSQLWERYVLPLKARYGVLTNGMRLIIYKRVIRKPEATLNINLAKFTEKACDLLFRTLRKPEYDITRHSKLEEYFSSVEKLSLKTDLAKDNFFETFKLEKTSVFGLLFSSLVDLFDRVYPRSRFLKGAYGFWQKSLAREPKKIPDSWKPFLEKDRDVLKLMFCLETTHALLARLILAKACEDLDFPGISVSKFTLQKIHQVRGQIPLIAYPIVLVRLIREMRDQLVYSIFEEDIFGWWTDAFREFMEKSSSELLQESVDKPLENFGRVIAKVIFMLYKFDFGEIAGDPLGDLYQQYFDRDTRKALGEFYTPVEVVNYILDAVGYENIGNKRLLDPACGSGTFIVEALKRYLTEAKGKAKKHGWAYVLRELCNSPKIVGFDIHPFACLIARTRFVLELIPYFKKALEEEAPRMFYLQRIPVFRTDSLAIETLPPEFQKQRQLAETKGDIVFPVKLPIRIDSESSISVSIILPSWRKILSHMLPLFNLDEYFCALQATFDTVKSLLSVGGELVPETSLQGHLKEYMMDKDFVLLANFFKPYADQILGEIKRIESEFEDGRLIKSIEDSTLAVVLKNYLRYNFVVGNPPYIRKERIDSGYKKEVLQKDFSEVYHGDNDICVYFIARGINWLEDKGNFGYIVSGKFMKTRYGKYIRAYIPQNSKLLQLIDLRGSDVFKEATNDPVILILERSKGTLENIFPYIRVIEDIPKEAHEERVEGILNHIRKHLGEEYRNDYLCSYPISQRQLLENVRKEEASQTKYAVDEWVLIPSESYGTFKKIKKTCDCILKKLCEKGKVERGVQTGFNKAFVIENREAIDKHHLEAPLIKPLLTGENVRKYKIDFQRKYLIYTRGMNIDEYPNVKSYLSQFKKALEKRWCVTHPSMGRKWFELEKPKEPDLFRNEKIICPDISKRNNFAYDDKKYFCLHTLYIIRVKKDYRNLYKYLLGILNSKVLEFYFKQFASYLGSLGYRYQKQYLERLPIKLPRNDLEKQLSDRIEQKVERILSIADTHRLVKGFPETHLPKYRLAGLELDEIRHTFSADHSELKPFISGLPGKGYVVYASKGEDSIWVDTKEKARYLVLALRNRKVKQNETVKILIPRDNSIVTEILEGVKKTVQEIKATPIEQLEEELNELVYQLYGLNEDDKAVVEGFLKKF